MKVSLALLASFGFVLGAQTPSNQGTPTPNSSPRMLFRAQLPEPAVPADPLELVTGDAQPVQTVEERSAVIKALTNAISLSNVRAHPYHRKTTFTSFGSTRSDGNWQLEDMSPGRNTYRWTAQGPAFSAVNLYLDQTLYSNQPTAALPVRLAQVRSAIFYVHPMTGPHATLRTTAANLNGLSVQCILLTNFGLAQGVVGGRRWEEAEYCINNGSGALVTYSPVPGYYILYDYSQAIKFHDKLIPNKFTINEAGRMIIEAQTTSVSDPVADPALFQVAGLNQIGVGSIMTAPWASRGFVPSDLVAEGASQVVILHGMQVPHGPLTDIEVVASSNAALNGAAVSHAANWNSMRGANSDVEPGATPQSHEVLATVTFFAPPPRQTR